MKQIRPDSLNSHTLTRATRRLARLDPDLRRLVRQHGPPPLWARPPGFATLVQIILEQQVSLASARAVFRRLQDLGEVSPATVLEQGEKGLRGCGFTRQKSGYCVDLAGRIRSGELQLDTLPGLPTDEVRRQLKQVRGIGDWSADIYLLMALLRPDVWPSGDLALAEGIRRLRGLETRPDPARQQQIARRWKPWRAVAARIVWFDYLDGKG